MIGTFFHKVREHRKAHPVAEDIPPAVVDEAAAAVADQIIGEFPAEIVLSIRAWGQVRAIIQSSVSIAIRHTAYDPPEYPGKKC